MKKIKAKTVIGSNCDYNLNRIYFLLT